MDNLDSYILQLKSANNFDDFKDLLQIIFSIIIKSADDEFINESVSIKQLLEFLLEQIWPNKRIETLHSRQLNEIKTLADLIGNFLITLMNNFQTISNEIQEKLWLFALVFQCDYLMGLNRISEKFLAKFLSLNQKSQFENYVDRKILKNTISTLKQHVGDGEEWPTIMGNSNIIDFIFKHLSYEKLCDYIFELFPVAMQILDNPLESNQSIGLKCLNKLLKTPCDKDLDKNCCNILNENGYMELIFDRMKILLHNTDMNYYYYFILIENFHLLLSYQQQQNYHRFGNQMKDLSSIHQLYRNHDEIYRIMIDNLSHKDNVEFLQNNLNALMTYIFPLMHCNLLKHGKITMKTINLLLDRILIFTPITLSLLIMEFICNFIQRIDGCLCFHDVQSMAVRLAKISIKFSSENSSNDNEQKQIDRQIMQIFNLLENSSSCNEKNVKFLYQFRSRLKILN